jgi:prophage endopeptidase
MMAWLVSNWKAVLIAGLMLMCVGFAADANRQSTRADIARKDADARQETIIDMQRRQKSVAALDAKYTQELADAKATIDQLQSDVVAGRKRLQLNATCPKQSTSSTSSLDDAASARLTDSAQRDYFTLRQRIETSGKMIAGLQQYLREQCLR